jgi:CCR4-NOT transcription complex subunit 7/8
MINELEDMNNYSLQKLGQEMEILRRGIQHQAGSDSLLTLELFFRIAQVHFRKGIPTKYYNNIFGIS